MVGVSFPSKEGQGTLSAAIWGAGGIWYCAPKAHGLCLPGPPRPCSDMRVLQCLLGWGLKALSKSAQGDLLTQSAPGSFFFGDCLSPGRQWATSPQNITLHPQDTGAVSLFCICSTWEVNLRLKRGAGLNRCYDGCPFWERTVFSGLPRK